MKKQLLLCFLFFNVTLSAESKYPVDISYMVADLKYSEAHGVKICEIQHGILSTFLGDLFLHGSDGSICPQIEQTFAEFPINKWLLRSQISFAKLNTILEASPQWKPMGSHASIFADPEFINAAEKVPVDPNSIASYQGMVYARPRIYKDYDQFRKTYPGIIVIDAPTHKYWVDKYKMTLLFNNNPVLSKIKPEWKLYPKEYTNTLAQQIIDDIPGDAFVIKPRSAFLGHGVILVSKDDLDKTLDYILNKSGALSSDPDKSYSHWYKDASDSFLVEKYYPSDPVQVQEMGDRFFEPTMRVAFMMIYNNKTIEIRFLNGYWMLPFKSIDETGTFNELKKAYCKPPYYLKPSSEVLKNVRTQLEETLPLLYHEMLEGS